MATSSVDLSKAPKLELTISDFELLRVLGEGSLSTVMLATRKATGTQHALKVIDKFFIMRHKMTDAVVRERHVITQLDSAWVVKLQFTFQDAQKLYMALEPCLNGDLYEQLQARKPLPHADLRFYAAEMVLMLECLRQHNVVFRDFKPENMLLDDRGHLKLTDFGCAKRMDSLYDVPAQPQAPANEADSSSMAHPTAHARRSIGEKADHDTAEASTCSGAADTAITSLNGNASKVARRCEGDGGHGSLGSGSAADAQHHTSCDHQQAPLSAPASAAQQTQQQRQQQQQRAVESCKSEGIKRQVSFVGTADYIPPETLDNTSCSCAADLWGFGCVLYQMSVGTSPFRGKSEYLTMQNIAAHNLTLPEGMHTDVRTLVESLLHPEPQLRLGFQDISELKAHALFAGVDWATLRESAAPVWAHMSATAGTSECDVWEMEALQHNLPFR